MEKEFFDWETWDDNGPFEIDFYKCVFKKDIGPFRAGEEYRYVTIDYMAGKMTSSTPINGPKGTVTCKIGITAGPT